MMDQEFARSARRSIRTRLLAGTAVLLVVPTLALAQAPPAKPAADESIVDQVIEWFKRSDRDYQDEVIKKLSEPNAPNPVTDAQKKLETDRKSAQGGTPAATPAPKATTSAPATPAVPSAPAAKEPPKSVAQPAPAPSAPTSVAQAPKTAPSTPPVATPAAPQAEESIVDQVTNWFKRSEKDYQDEVIKKLSEPTTTPTIATPAPTPAPMTPTPAPTVTAKAPTPPVATPTPPATLRRRSLGAILKASPARAFAWWRPGGGDPARTQREARRLCRPRHRRLPP